MARHRNVRAMQYDGKLLLLPNSGDLVDFSENLFYCFFSFNVIVTEFDDYDNIVGSVTDEPECISPTDARQWIFDRARGQSSLEQFLSNNEDIQEEDDEEHEARGSKERRDSEHYQLPNLNVMDKSKLLSCMDEIRSIIGETYSDKRLVEAIMSNDFDFNKALDTLLNGETKPPKIVPKPKIADAVEKGNFC